MNPSEFDYLAAAEEEMWWFRGMRRILFTLLDREVEGREIHRVVECGCGTGHMARRLEERYGWQVTPLDLEFAGLSHGRRAGMTRLVQGDMLELPFADNSFEAAVSLDALVHFAPGEERQVFGEFARVLRPGGLLVVRAAAFSWLRSRHSEWVMEKQRYTLGGLRKLAEDSGLRTVRATYANTLLLPVALAKFRILEPLLDARPQSGVRVGPPWMEEPLHAALALEAAWLKRGGSFPVGQSAILIAEKPGDSP